MIYSANDIAKSFKIATLLILNGLDVNDPTGVSSFNRDQDGRFLFETDTLSLAAVHGAHGTLAWPGVSIGYGKIRPYQPSRPDKFTLPIFITMIIETQPTVERAHAVIDQLAFPLKDFVFNAQECPVYSFDQDVPSGIIGKVTWPYRRAAILEPEIQDFIEPIESIGWIRKEHALTCLFTNI
jgi:hypothetical protein